MCVVWCLCVCVHVHEMEKAVALCRGRALLSLVGVGGGGVGRGRRGYVNGAAVRAAEGFEWRGGVGGGELQAARSLTEPPARNAEEKIKIQPSSEPCEPNTTCRRPRPPLSSVPPSPLSFTPTLLHSRTLLPK